MRLDVRVATITGNAEMIAEDVIDTIGDEAECDLKQISDQTFDELSELNLLLLISSTYGVGDIPDNGMAVYDRLVEEKPDLSHLQYGVIGLGDSTYADTFAFGGRKWDTALNDCGAQKIGEILILDASSGEDPTDQAVEWVEPWIELVKQTVDADPES